MFSSNSSFSLKLLSFFTSNYLAFTTSRWSSWLLFSKYSSRKCCFAGVNKKARIHVFSNFWRMLSKSIITSTVITILRSIRIKPLMPYSIWSLKFYNVWLLFKISGVEFIFNIFSWIHLFFMLCLPPIKSLFMINSLSWWRRKWASLSYPSLAWMFRKRLIIKRSFSSVLDNRIVFIKWFIIKNFIIFKFWFIV
jgi:hypothetical protein